MASLEEVADVLNGTLQEDTAYRGMYELIGESAMLDISDLELTEYVSELLEGLNDSEDGESFIFTLETNEQGKEIISITKK